MKNIGIKFCSGMSIRLEINHYCDFVFGKGRMCMRKWISLLLCIGCMLSSNVVYAANITGQAVHTDIVAYINALPIPSYNINGQTAIVAEDLAQYGFFVQYDNATRSLSVDYFENDNPITANYQREQNTKPIGSFAAYVYATDIVTYVNGEKVPSYNIDGRTLIFIDALGVYGDVTWYPAERKICYTYVPNWSYSISNWDRVTQADTSQDISGFSFEMSRNQAGDLIVTGENLQYFSNISLRGGRKPVTFAIQMYYVDISYYPLSGKALTIEDLFWQMRNWNIGEELTKDTDFANAHMKVWINGEAVPVTYVARSIGNGHTDYSFTFDQQVKTLEEIQSIRIECQ